MVNFHYYGIFCVNDRIQGPFAEMMELIYQVEDESTDEKVWVTKDMLWQCIDASPTLTSMREYVEGGFYSRVQEDGQIHGDIIQWALRVGFRDAGYYVDAKETQAMLSQVVDELNYAYDQGILKADSKIHLSAQGRGMTINEILNYIPVAFDNFFELSDYEGCYSYYPYYPMADEQLTEKFEIMLSTPLSESYINNALYVFTERLYYIIQKIYHKLGTPMLKSSLLIFVLLAVYELYIYMKKRKISRELEMLIPLLGMMLSGFLLIYVVSVFTSFLTFYNLYNYTTGIYIIFSIFEVFVVNHIWKVVKSIRIELNMHMFKK